MSLHEHVTKQTFWYTEKVKILLRAMYKFAWRLWVVNYTRSRQWNMRYKSLYLSRNMSKFYCVTSCEFDEKRESQNLSLKDSPHSFRNNFNPKQTFLLCNKLIMQGEKCQHRPKTCNETMLCDKLRVVVSRTLLPLKAVLLWISLPCMLWVPFSG